MDINDNKRIKKNRPLFVVLYALGAIVIGVALAALMFGPPRATVKYTDNTPRTSASSTDSTPTTTPSNNQAVFSTGNPTDAFTKIDLPSGTSNVVGYLASGAFVINVPDWMVSNWRIDSSRDGNSLTITPAENYASRDYSDISMRAAVSTEAYNAEYLSSLARQSAQAKGYTVSGEASYNHSGDLLIYRVESIRPDGTFTEDFFLNGNGKTAEIHFSAGTSHYLDYAPKVRDFVGQLGTGQPQG